MTAPAQDIFFDTLQSPLGVVYLVFADGVLAGVRFRRPRVGRGEAPAGLKDELRAYFEGELTSFSAQIRLTCGTPFERSVWLALKDVPYGQTRTYKWLAERVGRPSGARAVGQALSKNPLPIVLPCHRIIESDGDIGGYSSGVDIKHRLLKMEYYFSLNIPKADTAGH